MENNIEAFRLSGKTRELFEELPRRLYGPLYRSEEAPDGLPFFLCRGGDGAVLARAAAWANPLLFWQGRNPGLIGSFECARNDAALAGAVLAAAEGHLRCEGHDLAIGPLNGSTWNAYRIAEAEGAPCLFPLEPCNSAFYGALWDACGYSTLANYTSSRFDLSEASFPRLAAATGDLEKRGIFVRDFRPDQAADDLDAICDVARASFGGNFLYPPLSREEFLRRYRPFIQALRPHDAAIARRADGTPVGFVFGFPNHYAPEGAEYVVKTVAVLPAPDCRRCGLGRLLVERLARNAFNDGFRTAYHALMHEGNFSVRFGRHVGSSVCRRYRLFIKNLA